MKAKLATSALIVATLLAAVPAYAHHSFAAEFDVSKPTTVTGSVTKLDWINPHARLFIEVKGGWQSRELGNRARSAGNFDEKWLDKELPQSRRYGHGERLSG